MIFNSFDDRKAQRTAGYSADVLSTLELQKGANETFNQLRAQLLTKVSQQECLSRQQTKTFSGGTNQTGDESLGKSTFNKMHMDILLLQEKIKSLEAQMVSSPSEAAAKRDTLESQPTMLYKHD